MAWEYLVRTRVKERGRTFKTGDWQQDLPRELASLGRDNWELVAISWDQDSHSGGRTEEQWIFKRPTV